MKSMQEKLEEFINKKYGEVFKQKVELNKQFGKLTGSIIDHKFHASTDKTEVCGCGYDKKEHKYV